MKKHKYNFKVTAFILIYSLLVSGCYSYWEVSKEDYFKREEHNKSKIILKDKEEIEIESTQKVKLSSDSENIIINKDSSEINIPYSNITKIQEEKFDFGKTFLTSFWITLISILFVIFILLSWGSGLWMSNV